MKLYCYCVATEMPSQPPESTSGVTGSPLRVIDFTGLQVLVSPAKSDRVEVTASNVFAHDQVLRRVLNHCTPLPFRFGSLVTERQLSEYVEFHRGSLLTALKQVAGCVEMTVK